jgi:hypothetical protein
MRLNTPSNTDSWQDAAGTHEPSCKQTNSQKKQQQQQQEQQKQ